MYRQWICIWQFHLVQKLRLWNTWSSGFKVSSTRKIAFIRPAFLVNVFAHSDSLKFNKWTVGVIIMFTLVNALVHWSCYNKISQPWWFVNNKNKLPTVLEARKSKIRVPEHSVSGKGLLSDASSCTSSWNWQRESECPFSNVASIASSRGQPLTP